MDKSLLRWDGVARYDLHELVRQYAGEKLEELGKSGEIRKRHAIYFLGLAETAEPKLLSGKRDRWLDQLEREHDNLRAALAWSQVTAGAGRMGLRMVGALFWFWMYRSYILEGRGWPKIYSRQPMRQCHQLRGRVHYTQQERSPGYRTITQPHVPD